VENLFIGESPSDSAHAPTGWLWLKPVDGGIELYTYDDSVWVLKHTISFADHTHPTLGDINFTGTISAGGEAGITGARTIDGHTLTFKNGILVGYEAP